MLEIRLLPPELISRIAAGECVERPSSVVKELVENALDAGAKCITVATQDGGRDLIEVVDDGSGMDRENLRLCIAQHATSKISSDDDLFNIRTMGFRGEALASVGAVARLQITSRRHDADVGHTIRVDGGKVTAPQPCAARPGTKVEVRDLFFAVPARRKFLRTTQTESGHITEQFARIALAHPGVAFSLRSGARSVHDLRATSDVRGRIGDLYGRELADVLLPIRRDGDGVVVEGLVAPPEESRGSTKWEYVFVNGRYVRDRFVSHAIKEAYRSLIDGRRYPVAFLFITIDPERIDVNVHPMKTEIRWRDSNYVHGQVLAALRDKFLSTNLDHGFKPRADGDAYRQRVREAMVDFFTKARPERPTQQPTAAPGRPYEQRQPAPAPPHPAVAGQPDTADVDAADAAPLSPIASTFSSELPGLDVDASERSAQPRALQIHNAFILVETGDGLMIIDQHALHERILYEELSQRVKSRHLEAQRLLIPEVVRVPADRLEVLETHADMLVRLGIELNAVGPQSVALQAFPTLLQERGFDQGEFVRDILDLLSEHGSRPEADTLVHDVLDMMACKAAVKAGDPLTPQEIEALLARRELAERSSHCPHGRPTTLHLALSDLERQFHRK